MSYVLAFESKWFLVLLPFGNPAKVIKENSAKEMTRVLTVCNDSPHSTHLISVHRDDSAHIHSFFTQKASIKTHLLQVKKNVARGNN